MTTWKIVLIASLIGTAVGFWAWKLDLTQIVWPGHPQLAGFFLTLNCHRCGAADLAKGQAQDIIQVLKWNTV